MDYYFLDKDRGSSKCETEDAAKDNSSDKDFPEEIIFPSSTEADVLSSFSDNKCKVNEMEAENSSSTSNSPEEEQRVLGSSDEQFMRIISEGSHEGGSPDVGLNKNSGRENENTYESTADSILKNVIATNVSVSSHEEMEVDCENVTLSGEDSSNHFGTMPSLDNTTTDESSKSNLSSNIGDKDKSSNIFYNLCNENSEIPTSQGSSLSDASNVGSQISSIVPENQPKSRKLRRNHNFEGADQKVVEGIDIDKDMKDKTEDKSIEVTSDKGHSSSETNKSNTQPGNHEGKELLSEETIQEDQETKTNDSLETIPKAKENHEDNEQVTKESCYEGSELGTIEESCENNGFKTRDVSDSLEEGKSGQESKEMSPVMETIYYEHEVIDKVDKMDTDNLGNDFNQKTDVHTESICDEGIVLPDSSVDPLENDRLETAVAEPETETGDEKTVEVDMEQTEFDEKIAETKAVEKCTGIGKNQETLNNSVNGLKPNAEETAVTQSGFSDSVMEGSSDSCMETENSRDTLMEVEVNTQSEKPNSKMNKKIGIENIEEKSTNQEEELNEESTNQEENVNEDDFINQDEKVDQEDCTSQEVENQNKISESKELKDKEQEVRNFDSVTASDSVVEESVISSDNVVAESVISTVPEDNEHSTEETLDYDEESIENISRTIRSFSNEKPTPKNENKNANKKESPTSKRVIIVKTAPNVEKVKRKLEEILERSKGEEDAAISELQRMKREKTEILNAITTEMEKLKSMLVKGKQG